MTKPRNLFALAQAAIQYAQAVADTAHCKEVLRGGYMAWRMTTGNQHTDLARNDANWQTMMLATAGEYQHLRNAKGRERRALQKLLALAKSWEGAL